MGMIPEKSEAETQLRPLEIQAAGGGWDVCEIFTDVLTMTLPWIEGPLECTESWLIGLWARSHKVFYKLCSSVLEHPAPGQGGREGERLRNKKF